ncbi:MAG: NAD(P)H-quinone oxidoreductase, partial [Aeromicrobium sp.]
MRAIVVKEPGGVDALTLVDAPKPEPGPGEVLIKVAAAGINRADLLQRQGF